MNDKEYISQLEGLVCFLANVYKKNEEEFHGKHIKTCSVTNSERRDLTEQEKDELSRFSAIQGSKIRWSIDRIARFNIKPNCDISIIEEKIKNNNEL